MFVLFLIVFLDILGFGIIFPILPLLRTAYSLSEVDIGLLVSSFFIASIFGAIIIGYLSDLFGRKRLLMISLLFLIISYLGNGVIQYFNNNFSLFLLFRILSGFFSGNIAVTFASAANFSTQKNMLKNMSILTAGFTSGFILGPTIGGILLEIGSPIMPFYMTALSYLFCLIVVVFFFKEPKYTNNTPTESIIILLKKLLFNKKILFFVFLFVILSLSISSLETFFITYSLYDKLQLSPIKIALTWAYFAILTTLVQLFICKYIKPSYAIIVGFALWGGGIFLLSFVDSFYLTLVIIAIFSIGLGLVFPNINSHLALSGSASQQGTIFGINFAAEAVGGSIGPYALGHVLFFFGSINYVWFTLGIVSLIAIISSIFYYKKI